MKASFASNPFLFKEPAIDIANIFATDDVMNAFHNRRLKVFEYYTNVCDGTFRLKSHIISGEVYGFGEESRDSHILFVYSNQVYESIGSSYNIVDHPMIQRITTTNEVSHIALTDIFGRILSITAIESKASCNSFYEMYYHCHAEGLFNWFTRPHRLVLPFGNMISSINHLNLDRLGFRVSKSSQNPTNDARSTLKIGFLGGSFVSSIWSLPGESFCEILESLLNTNSQTTQYNVINLSNPGHVQSDGFNFIINTGIYKSLDYVVWFDGVNDLLTTVPAFKLGLKGFDTPISLKYNGTRIDQTLREVASLGEKIDSYLAYRKQSNEILGSLGIKTINILQPTIDKRNTNQSGMTKSLFPYYSLLSYNNNQNAYVKAHDLIRAKALASYGLEIIIPDHPEIPYEFWDIVHLSPKGEKQVANWLFSVLADRLE